MKRSFLTAMLLIFVCGSAAFAQLAVPPKTGQTTPFPANMTPEQRLSVVVGSCQGWAAVIRVQRAPDQYKVYKTTDAGDTDRAVYYRYAEAHVRSAEIVAANILKLVRSSKEVLPASAADRLEEAAIALLKVPSILEEAERQLPNGRQYWYVDQEITRAMWASLQRITPVEESLRQQLGRNYHGLFSIKGRLNVVADYLENLQLVSYRESPHYVAAAKMVYGQTAWLLFQDLDRLHKQYEKLFSDDLNARFRKAFDPLYSLAAHGHALNPDGAWMSKGDEKAVRQEMKAAAQALRDLMLVL